MNPMMEVIRNRRSIRSFTEQPVTADQLEQLKTCALFSPTAMNRRAWHFSFVKNQALLDAVEQEMVGFVHASGDPAAIERMEKRNNKVFHGAPLVVFLHVDPSHPWADVDCGIAVQNLALGAQAIGLGSCIVGMIKPIMTGDRGAVYRKKMDVPAGYVFSIAIAIGEAGIQPERPPAPAEPVTVIE